MTVCMLWNRFLYSDALSALFFSQVLPNPPIILLLPALGIRRNGKRKTKRLHNTLSYIKTTTELDLTK